MSSTVADSSQIRVPFRPSVLPVLQQHLEEHAFLQLQRRKLIFATDFPLRRLPEHDERIDAHWDGLVIGADDSVKVAEHALGGEEPWEIATAARVWIELARPSAAAVAARLSEAPPEQSAAWREALRQSSTDRVAAALPEKSLASLPPHAFAIAVDAHGWHGQLAPATAQAAARHGDVAVRAALARTLSHSGLGDEAARYLGPLLDDPDATVRRRALWSAARLAAETCLERARRAIRGPQPDAFALRVVGLLGESEDCEALAAAAMVEVGRPCAWWALADLGTRDAVESLLQLLAGAGKEPARLVGDALESAIGTIRREDVDAPPTPQQAREHWAALAQKLPRGACVMEGRPRPWAGEPSEEPMRWVWRSAIGGRRKSARWLRGEVPDGFFDALPAPDARPGE